MTLQISLQLVPIHIACIQKFHRTHPPIPTSFWIQTNFTPYVDQKCHCNALGGRSWIILLLHGQRS
uniref:Uncharacterized protein n=1 Tax=Arundo donax TaxID=35708 RepID=A0A0A9CDJ0_ARUDO